MNRRLILIGALVAALAAGGAVAGVVLAAGGGKNKPAAVQQQQQQGPVNMHPVAGNFKPDETKLSDCNSERCYEQAFGDVAYYQGPKAALALFQHEMATNSAINSGCHPIAHYIGAGTLARNHGNIPKSFAAGSSICWSGFYHGILERAFYGISTESGLIKAARRVCSDPSLQKDEFLFYQCVHGLGHGLMISTGYDLPYALHVCQKLQTAWDQSSCTGGVYMENVNAANGTSIGFKTTWVRANDLVYPCDSPVTKGLRLYCYLMVTSRILAANGYNWAATAKICSNVEKIWIATCFQSFGRDADGSTAENPTRDVALCKIAGRWHGECIYGAVRDMTSYFAGVERPSAFCAIVDAAYKGYCYQGIGTIVGTLRADTPARQAMCKAASPRRFLDACLRGAGVPVTA